MPAKIPMQIGSVVNPQFIEAVKKSQARSSKAPMSLRAGMISRIHNVRPGCGSCGK